MGTSSSFRAPPKPRWQAFIAALLGESSLDRTRSELFNAGDQWEEALAATAIASYANSALLLYEAVPLRVEGRERPADEVSTLVADARGTSFTAGFSPAQAVAERAFARVILATIDGIPDDGLGAGDAAASSWVENRGREPGDLLVRYVGELFDQFARHVTDREAGRLAHRERGAAATARLTEALAQRAAAIGRSSAASTYSTEIAIDAVWEAIVAKAFTEGRGLPRAEQ
jgi:hypothetical protein